MSTRARVFAGSLLLAVSVGGCPVTDDYYLLEDDASASGKAGSDAAAGKDAGGGGGNLSVIPGGSDQGAAAQGAASQGGSGRGGSGQGGSAQGGTSSGAPPTGGSDAAGASGGEASSAGAASEGGAGGVPPEECSPTTERCNGHDDDCDGGIDEFGVCPNGCSGFVLVDDPKHGYMYCTSGRDYSHAGEACADQTMRLAWLDSSLENAGVSEQLDALGDDTEVLIGATDQAKEGDWLWSGGGPQFWRGNQNGTAVGGQFAAWTPGTPDSFGGNEDCASVNPTTQRWSDRSCSADFSYLCEDVPAP